MKKGIEIALYGVGAISLIALANQIVKNRKSGVGLFTTKKAMGKFVGMSSEGLNTPYTKDTIKDFLEFWDGLGDNYAKEWYKAVWETEKGNPTPTFSVNGKTFFTKGGSAKK
jgi:hypothetical protein